MNVNALKEYIKNGNLAGRFESLYGSDMGFGISFNLKDGFMHMQPDASSGQLAPVYDPATVGNFVSTSESYLGINLGAFTLFVEYFQL